MKRIHLPFVSTFSNRNYHRYSRWGGTHKNPDMGSAFTHVGHERSCGRLHLAGAANYFPPPLPLYPLAFPLFSPAVLDLNSSSLFTGSFPFELHSPFPHLSFSQGFIFLVLGSRENWEDGQRFPMSSLSPNMQSFSIIPQQRGALTTTEEPTPTHPNAFLLKNPSNAPYTLAHHKRGHSGVCCHSCAH